MKQFLKHFSFLATPPAFWTLTLGVILLALVSFPAALFVAVENSSYYWWEWFGMAGQLLVTLASLTVLAAIAIAGMLTLTGQWDTYLAWVMLKWDLFCDRRSSVTTRLRVVRQRFGLDTKGAASKPGFLLTMAPRQMVPPMPPSPITFDDDRHVTMIAGSRAGKGRAFIIPNLAQWQGSAIVYDPSGENYAATAKYRREVLGQKVVLLDPFGVTDDPSDVWNPMAEIDFDHDPQAIDKCHMLAESLHNETGGDPYWMHAPRKMLAMLIAYVGTRALPEQMHLGQVRDLLMTSDPAALWLALARNEAFDGLIRRFGESNENRHEEELASTMEIARTAMKWLDSGLMNSFTRQSSFSMRELKEGKLTIYIVLPAGMGDTYKAWLRLLFNAAFEAMQDLSIAKPEHATLFLMDEFPLMGRMERIKRAAGEAAKFGVKLMICAQDISQLKEHYGDTWETFIANSGLLIMFANNDLECQRYLSERLGKEYYKKYSRSSGSSSGQASSSTSTSYELRDVARPEQVANQTSRQSGDTFFFVSGMKPMRLARANYDEWNMLAVLRQKASETKAANDADALSASVAAE